jgi:hypothetical protein
LCKARQWEEALSVCDRLEWECGDDLTAHSSRAAIFLNMERWSEALASSTAVSSAWPIESFVSAFALFEIRSRLEALACFLHGAFNHPVACRILVGARRKKPSDQEGRADHDAGIAVMNDLAVYLEGRGKSAKRFFRRILRLPQMEAMLGEVEQTRHRWTQQHERGHREAFDRRQEMQSLEYAKERARELLESDLASSRCRGI